MTTTITVAPSNLIANLNWRYATKAFDSSKTISLEVWNALEETLIFAAEQLAVVEASDWATEALEAALKKFGEEKGWSVKENFMLLRAIVTGGATSPPMLESLMVFGKARTLDRMRRFLESQKEIQKRLANQKK